MVEQIKRVKRWRLRIYFGNNEEFKKFIEENKKRMIFGIKGGIADPRKNLVIVRGHEESRLILKDLEKEVLREYPSATTKILPITR